MQYIVYNNTQSSDSKKLLTVKKINAILILDNSSGPRFSAPSCRLWIKCWRGNEKSRDGKKVTIRSQVFYRSAGVFYLSRKRR